MSREIRNKDKKRDIEELFWEKQVALDECLSSNYDDDCEYYEFIEEMIENENAEDEYIEE